MKIAPLIHQGERDPCDGRDEITRYCLPGSIRFRWLLDGDYSFRPRSSSRHSLEQGLDSACKAVAGFLC